MALYPLLEAWATGDRRPHHLLDRPRNAPTRTAIGAMSLTFYCLLWAQGGNDIIASTFDINVFAITWSMRIALFVVPPLVFVFTKRVCLGLQRRDRDKLLHGYESGIIKRLPSGKYYEQHQPISDEERAVLMARAACTQAPADAREVRRQRRQAEVVRWSRRPRRSCRTSSTANRSRCQRSRDRRSMHHEAEVTAERNDEIRLPGRGARPPRPVECVARPPQAAEWHLGAPRPRRMCTECAVSCA